MMKRFLFFALVLSSFVLKGQVNDSLFSKANNLYIQENYSEAIDSYSSIIGQGYQSEDLYYNIANCYFKTDQIALSILYYKRALKLNPNMEDAIFNLEMAQSRVVDKIEKLPQGAITRLWKWFSELINVESWSILAVILSFVSAGLFLVYLLSANSNLKRLSFVLASSLFALMLLSVVISHQQNSWQENNRDAVVISENSYVKLAPNATSEDSFILHEGTSVLVVDEIGDWLRIKLSDGKMGWINKLDITIV